MLSDVNEAWHGEIAEQAPSVYAAVDAAGIVHGKVDEVVPHHDGHQVAGVDARLSHPRRCTDSGSGSTSPSWQPRS